MTDIYAPRATAALLSHSAVSEQLDQHYAELNELLSKNFLRTQTCIDTLISFAATAKELCLVKKTKPDGADNDFFLVSLFEAVGHMLPDAGDLEDKVLEHFSAMQDLASGRGHLLDANASQQALEATDPPPLPQPTASPRRARREATIGSAA